MSNWSMVNMLDLLQCPVCGTFYKPETTHTGQSFPHCVLPIDHGLSHGQLIERGAMETGVVGSLLTDVVEPPLTGSFLDIEV